MGTKLTTSMTSVVFSELPVHETIWSITTGADGKIYAGICGELTGGLSVFLVRYNPDTARYEYLLEVGPALNDPANNGRAPQSKIHYSLIPASTGELYCATHCSGPPLEQRIWRPWHTWDDPERMFSGFHIFRYDPATGDMNDFGVMHPNEGCRAMALAEKRQKLYGVTWPRDHFFVFDIKERRYQDLGRIGDINPQSIWIDAEENGYTIDDLGQMVKYCADEQRLMHLDVRIPSEPGLPCSVYDTVPAPDGRGVYGVTWNMEKTHSPDRLFRYDPAEGTEGKIYDLGPTSDQKALNHTGGLVFGADGYLYYAASKSDRKRRVPYRMYLYRMDVESLQREEVCPFDDGDWHSEYISKATRDRAGNLYFADTNNRPTRIYIYSPEKMTVCKNNDCQPLVRSWG